MNLLDTLLKIGKYIIFGLGILTSFVIFLIIFLVIFVNKIFPEPIPKESFASLDLESSVVYIDYSGDCGATCGFGDVNLYQKSKSFPEDYPELLLSLPEHSPHGYKIEKLNNNQIIMYKEGESYTLYVK
jgi:hypothetical protein